MSIYPPPEGWFKAPHGEERVWVGLAIVWCVVMTIAMPYWYFFGQQNSRGEAYRVTPDAFAERVDRFVETNKVGELQGVPVAQPAPGGDAYLKAQAASTQTRKRARLLQGTLSAKEARALRDATVEIRALWR